MKGITPKELSYVTWKWLKATGLTMDKNFVEQEITTHPDYPSILSVVDFLDSNNFYYQAVKAREEHFKEMQYPLLAHMVEADGTPHFTLVGQAEEWEKKSDIYSKWSGVVIFPDGKPNWDNKAHIKRFGFNQYRELIALLLFIGVTGSIAFTTSLLSYTIFSLLSLAGIVISWFTFKTELGYQNQIVKQVCNSLGSAGNCDNVMKSVHAKGIWGITPSVAGLSWFLAQWGVLILAGYLDQLYLVYAIYFSSLLGVLVTIWSVYVQKKVVKQWCVLCLGVATVLILQATVSCIIFFEILNNISFFSLTIFPIIFITVILLIIQPLKTLLQNTLTKKKIDIELRHWKKDYTIFMSLLQRSKNVDSTTWDDEILIGNTNAPIKITIACNPYCKPCAVTHKVLDTLPEKYPDLVALQVRFALNKGIAGFKYDAVRMILQHIKAGQSAKQLLHDWFDWVGDGIEAEKWKKEYGVRSDIDVESIIDLHEQWTELAGIEFTPTIYINGKKLPGKYDYTSLTYFVKKMIEAEMV